MSGQQTNELATITSVSQHYEAYMLKALLEEEGITVFLQDELFAQLYTNALGGIKIQVPSMDADRARKVLMDNGHVL